MDTNQIHHALYGRSDATATAKAGTQPTDAPSLAHTLYGADPALALRPAFVNRQRELETVVGLTSAERAKFEQDATALIVRSGLNPAGAGRRFYDRLVNAKLAEARAGTVADVDREAWLQQSNERTREELRALYGDRSDALLADVNRHVEAIPELKAALEAPIPGGNEIVLDLVNVVRSR